MINKTIRRDETNNREIYLNLLINRDGKENDCIYYSHSLWLQYETTINMGVHEYCLNIPLHSAPFSVFSKQGIKLLFYEIYEYSLKF